MVNQDLQHLKLLSILHYVAGGILGFFSCLPIIHLTLGIIFLVVPGAMTGGAGEPPPAFLGWLFVIIGVGTMLFGWSLAICLLFAGRFLARRTHYLFCLIAAGLGCLWMPVGTVLGVFTIIVLLRPSVKELFERPRGLQRDSKGLSE